MTYPTAVRNAEERSCVPCRVRGEPDANPLDTPEQRGELATFY